MKYTHLNVEGELLAAPIQPAVLHYVARKQGQVAQCLCSPDARALVLTCAHIEATSRMRTSNTANAVNRGTRATRPQTRNTSRAPLHSLVLSSQLSSTSLSASLICASSCRAWVFGGTSTDDVRVGF